MVEARLAAIRPLVHIDVKSPSLENIDDPGGRTVRSQVVLHNHGRGPAHTLDVSVSLRYEREGESNWITTDLYEPPVASLGPGQSKETGFYIPGFPTGMDNDRKEFMQVRASYRDGEGNYYALQQLYDLRAVQCIWGQT
jgi:hypothetical protein